MNEAGGAVVETAILSLIMVPLAIYSIFMYEFAMINLKASEVARYTAWEMTAMQMSDYESYAHHNNKDGFLKSRMSELELEVKERWGDDMNSATVPSDSNLASKLNGTLFAEKHSGLIVTKFDGGENGDAAGAFLTVNLTDSSPYDDADEIDPNDADPVSEDDTGILGGLVGNLSSFLGRSAGKFYDKFWFNTQGFVGTEIGVQMRFSHTAPIYKGEGMYIDGSGNATNLLPKLKGKEKIVADAWDLKAGGDVDMGQVKGPEDSGAGTPYLNQVGKIAFLGLVDKVRGALGDFGDTLSSIGDLLGIRDPFSPVVRSFALKHYDTDVSNNRTQSALKFEGGKSAANPVKGAPLTFYTNTYKDTFNEKDKYSYYTRVFARQTPNGDDQPNLKSTGYYMGCDEPQTVDRTKCWKDK